MPQILAGSYSSPLHAVAAAVAVVEQLPATVGEQPLAVVAKVAAVVGEVELEAEHYGLEVVAAPGADVRERSS